LLFRSAGFPTTVGCPPPRPPPPPPAARGVAHVVAPARRGFTAVPFCSASLGLACFGRGARAAHAATPPPRRRRRVRRLGAYEMLDLRGCVVERAKEAEDLAQGNGYERLAVNLDAEREGGGWRRRGGPRVDPRTR
jgi:hypothetical protein